MRNIKPCPFCGSIPTDKIKISAYGGGDYYAEMRISCPECNGKGAICKWTGINFHNDASFEDFENAINEVIEAWNKRANDGTDWAG